MRSNLLPSLAVLSAVPLSFAAPAPVAAPVAESTPVPIAAPSPENVAGLEERQLLGGVLGLVGGLLNEVNSAIKAANPQKLVNALVQITPTSRPIDIAGVVAQESAIWGSPTQQTNFFAAVATQVASGLILDGTLKSVLNGGLAVGENSIDNNNPPPPASASIYPKKNSDDAPYSLPEATLRKAIYIPQGFTYGSKRPVIFVPGTGSYGGTVFAPNLRKLLTNVPYADPVWLNIPGAMLDDTQTNAEYIAYAINYISAVSKNSQEIAVITWSQGGLDTQWVLKYWSSARSIVTDFLPVSADFRGTILGNVLCLSADSKTNPGACAPAAVQQSATSKFVSTLQSNGGDSAYVPTTSFYTGFFDEVVQPQQGTGASAYINDARGVGALNVEVQSVCAGELAGSFYDHAGILFNPIVAALVVDALTNDGPGRLDRVDVKTVCSTLAADGLDLDDVLATTGLIPLAGALLLASPQRAVKEPALRAYAM